MRLIIAIIAGLITGSLTIWAVQSLGHLFYPMPADVDPNDLDELATYVQTAPFMALFFVVLSYGSGAFVSGFTAAYIARSRALLAVSICMILFLGQSLFMMSSLPTPLWFWVLGILSWGLALLGMHFNQKRLNG